MHRRSDRALAKCGSSVAQVWFKCGSSAVQGHARYQWGSTAEQARYARLASAAQAWAKGPRVRRNRCGHCSSSVQG
eukprot:2021075-Pyramimonas_sp.AAC.1